MLSAPSPPQVLTASASGLSELALGGEGSDDSARSGSSVLSGLSSRSATRPSSPARYAPPTGGSSRVRATFLRRSKISGLSATSKASGASGRRRRGAGSKARLLGAIERSADPGAAAGALGGAAGPDESAWLGGFRDVDEADRVLFGGGGARAGGGGAAGRRLESPPPALGAHDRDPSSFCALDAGARAELGGLFGEGGVVQLLLGGRDERAHGEIRPLEPFANPNNRPLFPPGHDAAAGHAGGFGAEGGMAGGSAFGRAEQPHRDLLPGAPQRGVSGPRAGSGGGSEMLGHGGGGGGPCRRRVERKRRRGAGCRRRRRGVATARGYAVESGGGGAAAGRGGARASAGAGEADVG